jgi:putative oxidoreductase
MRGTEVVRGVVDGAVVWLERFGFIAPLATRIVIGLAFLQTGLGKWAHMDRTADFFASLGIPLPGANAAFVATLELVGGGALVVGLLTRPFAALLSSTMIVALLTADREAFLASWSRASETSPTDVTSFVFLLFLLWLLTRGPGTLSLDRLRRLHGQGRGRRQGRRPPRLQGPERLQGAGWLQVGRQRLRGQELLQGQGRLPGAAQEGGLKRGLAEGGATASVVPSSQS